jgi:hypothetical protein
VLNAFSVLVFGRQLIELNFPQTLKKCNHMGYTLQFLHMNIIKDSFLSNTDQFSYDMLYIILRHFEDSLKIPISLK